MKGIQRAAMIVCKILEIGHWVAVGLMAVAGVLAAVYPAGLRFVIDVESLKQGGELSVYGLEVEAVTAAGELNTVMLCLFAIGAVVLFALMALVFHNLYGIIRQAEQTTPFCEENIRRLKRIGRCSFLVPLIGLAVNVIIRLVIGAELAEVSMDQSGIIMGLIVLCLTEYFAHGAKLERDVDGLL